MKKIVFSVIIVGAITLVSCTKKIEKEAALISNRTFIFSPKIVVATAD